VKAPAWIVLALLLTSPGALAQEDAYATDEPAATVDEENAATGEPGVTQEEPAPDIEPDAEATDPFDYRASEQISEDLSVSFPVDI